MKWNESRVWLFATSWTVTCQASLSMEFSRQEDCSGYPFPSPGYFPNPGVEPGSSALQVDSLPVELSEVHSKVDFGAQENKICHCFSPSICHEVIEPDAMILVFWMLSFKPAFSLSSFTFIKRLFSSSSLSAIKVVSSEYLRLLILCLSILIPICASPSSAFHRMYSECKLNKQGDKIQFYSFPNLEPVCCFMSSSNSCFFTSIQLSQESGQVVWYSHLLKIFHNMLWSTQSKVLA